MKFSTSQLAKLISVHPNTVRWYEAMGLISPAVRLPNNYRRFNYKHLVQLRICRIIYGSTYPGREARKYADNIIYAIKDWDLVRGIQKAKEYRKFIEKEYSIALDMAAMLANPVLDDPNVYVPDDIDEHATNSDINNPDAETKKSHTRKEAAALIGVTVEVLRNWERNGLLYVERTGKKNERLYGSKELMRMRIIFILRRNNHGISAIHRSLICYDEGNYAGAALALNQAVTDPDRIYACASDHWLEVLWELSHGAQKIIEIIKEIKS